MCGRYRAQASAGDIEKLWKVPANEAAESALERVEVKPTTQIAVVTNDQGVRMEALRWGLKPGWMKTSRPLINARSDKLASSNMWKRMAANPDKRCLVVADGYYEWLRSESGDSRPQPFLHLVDGGVVFAMAGLVDVAMLEDETVPAATIVTTDAAGAAARIHTRMPVLLPDRERQQAWLRDDLSLDDVVELCQPWADGLGAEPTELPSSAGRNSA